MPEDAATRVGARGFTLFELVLVIAIVALLASIALPRYSALHRDARVSKVQAIHAAVRGAATLAKLRCEVDLARGAGSGCAATPAVIDMDGLPVTMRHRYPTADAAGIDAAAQVSPRDGVTITQPGANAPRAYDIAGGADSRCRVTYAAPAADGRAPVIDFDISGC